MTARVPIVSYLVLDDPPRLRSNRCTACGALYFDERVACARCGLQVFDEVAHPVSGRVGSFTIVHRASPGIETPYVSAVVYLDDGTAVKTNIVGCPPDPQHVHLDMPVVLETFPVGTDDAGTEAIGFAFTPQHSPTSNDRTHQ
jgi:uncharacterized OB-fold protein